jgi:hypothetical protein
MSYAGDTEYDDIPEVPEDESASDATDLMGLAGKYGTGDNTPLGVYIAGVKAREARMNKDFFAPQQNLWNKYTKALQARRAGPDFSERMYQLAGALLKPTDYKGFSATLGNVAPVLAQQHAALRDAENTKNDLLMKYQLQMQQAKGQQLKSQLASEDAQARALLSAQVAAAKGKKPGALPRVIVDPQGLARHPNLGAELLTPPQQAVDELLADPSKAHKFDEVFGRGSAKLYLDYYGGDAEGR